jgi:hypothetical protein
MDNHLESILEALRAEFIRATTKFGSYNSSHEGYAVILEELDELWDEIKPNRGYSEAAMEEALQVAVTAIRYIYDLSGRD